MSQNKINLGTAQTSDVDLTSSVQIATITNAASYDRMISFRFQIGDGSKDLDAASGTTLTLITEVAGVKGEAIEAVTTDDQFISQNFPVAVRVGETLKLYCESDDANDTDVGVIVYPVDEGQMSPITAGRQPAMDASGVVESNIKEINDSSLAAARLALSAAQIIPGTVDTTAVSATTTSFESDDITEATNDHFNGRIIIFTGGVLAGQATAISDYTTNGGNGVFTVVGLTESPSDNDTFIVV